MPVLYEAVQSALKTKEGKKLFHPRVIRTGYISTAQIAQEVAAYSSLTSGDVKNTLDNLIRVMTTHLQASASVTLEGLGTFRMSMISQGRGVETPKEVSASQAALTVRFQPTITRHADGRTATRAMVTGAKCVRMDLADASLEDLPAPGDGGETPGRGEDETPDPTI